MGTQRTRRGFLGDVGRGMLVASVGFGTAFDMGCDRSELLNLRHRLQDLAFRHRDIMPLDDPVLEADETYQNAGEKRRAAPRPGRPAAAAGQREAPGTAPGRTIGRRSAASSGGRAARSG